MEINKNKDEEVKLADKLKQKITNLLTNYFRRIVFILVITILITGYFIFIKPKYDQMVSNAKSETDELENNYTNRQRYLTRLVHLSVAYRQISEENKAKIEALVPNNPEVEKLISGIESIALKNSLILTSLSVEAQDNKTQPITSEDKEININQSPGNIATVKISMDVAGTDYFALKNLLKTIENNLRLLDVLSVKFNVGDKKTSLGLQAYYLP